MGDAERFQVLRPLGSDGATFAARDSAAAAGSPRLVALERVTGGAPKADERAAALRRVGALLPLVNPRIVRVRDVVDRENEVLAVYDFVDGDWLSVLTAHEPRSPLDITLRMVLDVLDGLAALHDLRDERGQVRPIVHGAVTPDAVLVGLDGVAQVARACRLQRSGTEERYVAPELRQPGGTPDVRSDIYSVGTILRDLLGATTPEEKWAETVTEIAWRACSFERESRWPSALTMAAALRRSIGTRLATPAKIAAFARDRFGERVRARRIAMESLDEGSRPSVESVRPSDMEVLAEVSELQSDPKTLRPPRLSRPAVGRVDLARAADRWGAHDDEAGRRMTVTTQRGLAPPPPRPHPVQSPAPPQAAPPVPPAARPQGILSVPPPVLQVASPAPPPVPPRVPPSPSPAAPPHIAPPPPLGGSLSPLEPSAPQEPELDEFFPAAVVQPVDRPYTPSAWPPEPPAVRPVRSRFVLQAAVVAGGMVLTFAIGWWAGRSGPIPAEGSSAAPASASVEERSLAPSGVATGRPPSTAAAANLQAPSPPTPAESSAPSASATAFPSAALAAGPSPAASSATAPPPATPPATTTPPNAAPPAPFAAKQPAAAPPRETPAPARPAAAPPVASPSPRAVAPAATQAPKATAAPAPSGSYNPSEL